MQITARYPWATLEIWMWIDAIQDTFGPGIEVRSLYRPTWYNTYVGGLWNSYHLKAKAADLAPVNGMLLSLESAARQTAPHKGQVVMESNKGIIHIEIED